MTTINKTEEFAALLAELLMKPVASRSVTLEANKETLIHLIRSAATLSKEQPTPEHVEAYLNEVRISAIGYTMSILHLIQQSGLLDSASLTPIRELLTDVTSHYVEQSVILKEAITRSQKGPSDEEIPN